jgi:hypothetical protein
MDQKIVDIVRQKIKRDFKPHEVQFIQTKLKTSVITQDTFPTLLNEIMYYLIQQSSKEDIDLKPQFVAEIQKKELPQTTTIVSYKTNTDLNKRVTSLLEEFNINALSRKLNPSSHLYYNYIYVDSRTANPASPRNALTWYLNGENPVIENSYINVIHKLRRITYCRVSRVNFNHLHFADFVRMYWPTGYKICMEIVELSEQSHIGPTGQKYHFSFAPVRAHQQGNSFLLSPFGSNRGWFRFAEPHHVPNSLTFKFFDILNPAYLYNIPDDFATIVGTQTLDIVPNNYMGGAINFPFVINDIQRLMLYIAYTDKPLQYKPPANAGPGTTLPFLFKIVNISTGNPAVDAILMGIYGNTDVPLEVIDTIGLSTEPKFIESYFATLIDISPPEYNILTAEVTLQFQYKPNYNFVLEFVHENIDL